MTSDPCIGEELTDGALQSEIELVGELVVAASASPGRLSQEEIDEVLGIPSDRRAAAGAPVA
jgi:hypothetical protein